MRKLLTARDFIVPIINNEAMEPVDTIGIRVSRLGLEDEYDWYLGTNHRLKKIPSLSILVSDLIAAIDAALKAPMRESGLPPSKQTRQILYAKLKQVPPSLYPGEWEFEGYTFAEDNQLNDTFARRLPWMSIPALILEDIWDPYGSKLMLDCCIINNPAVVTIARRSMVYPMVFDSRQEQEDVFEDLLRTTRVAVQMVKNRKYKYTWEVV